MNLDCHATIQVATDANVGLIRIVGRANFVCARRLRECGLHAIHMGASDLVIDCRHCETMDSTFMGVLVMLAQRLPPRHVRLCDAGTKVVNALNGLGLVPFFTMTALADLEPYAWDRLAHTTDPAATTTDEQRRLMLDAHETLGQAEPSNIPKFEGVVKLLRKNEKPS